MPRGVSRAKHPELYTDTKKSVGTGRRVKTGAKTGGRIAGGKVPLWSTDLENINTLANVRSSITSNVPAINNGLVSLIDEIMNFELTNLRDRFVQNQETEKNVEGAVIERTAPPAPVGAPQFNPPPPQPHARS